MYKNRAILFCMVWVLLGQQSAKACIWDSETLALANRRFPGVMELITGKFLRHSRALYEWRIEDRKAVIESGMYGPLILDDLAVSHEKLGDHAKAIEVMQQNDQLFPGRYETHANLGTFYLHAGEFQKGIEEIKLAIKINPDAHFGREVYQQYLAEFILTKQKGGVIPKPLHPDEGKGFVAFLLSNQNPQATDEEKQEELRKALEGIKGMMRFGHFDSPILLEVLAELLVANGGGVEGRVIAACALLKASYECEGEAAEDAYRKLALQTLILEKDAFPKEKLEIDEIEPVFQRQLAEAKEWFEEVEANEKAWIDSGKNPEEEFAKTYPAEPQLSLQYGIPERSWYQRIFTTKNLGLLFIACILFIPVFFCVRLVRSFRESGSASS